MLSVVDKQCRHSLLTVMQMFVLAALYHVDVLAIRWKNIWNLLKSLAVTVMNAGKTTEEVCVCVLELLFECV